MIKHLVYDSPAGKSDHCVLNFSFIRNFYKSKTINNISKFDFNSGKYNLMNDYLIENLYCDESEINNNVASKDSVNNMWHYFCQVMNEAIRNYIPVIDADRILRFKCHKRKLPKNVVEQCRTKNKLWKKFIRTRDNNIFAEFKNIRNKLRKSINKIKEAETLKLAKKIKTNPKVFWQHINKNRNCQAKLEYSL